MSGHVFVIAGDVTALACDAWLLPTDSDFQISATFAEVAAVTASERLSGHNWAGSRVVELDSEAKGEQSSRRPRIWLGDVGRCGADASWYAGVIEPFAVAAKAALSDQVPHRPPLLAINVIGTGEGGMDADKGSVHRALLPEMLRVADLHEVDLVLVCWGNRSYSAAQRVRRQLLEEQPALAPTWDMGPQTTKLTDDARRIGRAARLRNIVLFLGAGVSAGAGLPTWQRLLDDIAERLEIDPKKKKRLGSLDFRDQAAVLHQLLEASGTHGTLQEEVAKRLGASGYSLTHGLLASLPTTEAVTTNYDDLFENAATAADGRPPAVLPYQPVAPGQRWLLKLHGSLDRDDSIVLTRSDYLDIPTRHGALFGLVQAMLLTRHMLFVGYSLTDEDFHHLTHEVRLARQGVDDAEPLGTVLTLFDDPLFADLWPDLSVVAMAGPAGEIPTDEETAEAGRWLQIFCDLVAFEAADLDTYLLDPTYRDLLDETETALVETLEALKLPSAEDGTAIARVRRLLEALGKPASGGGR